MEKFIKGNAFPPMKALVLPGVGMFIQFLQKHQLRSLVDGSGGDGCRSLFSKSHLA